MNHTPGPWNACHGEIFSFDNDARIAQVFSGQDSQRLLNKAIKSVEADCNARLIAAAPDLLTAVESLMEQVEQMRGLFVDEDNAIADALADGRDAIAKAKGA